MPTKYDHTHIYERAILGNQIGVENPYIVYKCMIPGCTHYTPESLIIGRLSKCCECKRTAVEITKNLVKLKRVRFKCQDCIKEKFKKMADKRLAKTLAESEMTDE